MINELKNKRSKLVSDMKSLRDLIVKEKRALSDEEKEKLESLKAELEAIKQQIADLEAIEAEEAEEAERQFKAPSIITSSRNTDSNELKKFLRSRTGNFQVDAEKFFKRAAITTATDPSFKTQNTSDYIFVDAGQTPLIAAVGTQFLPKGTMTVPLTKGLVGQFVDIGGSASDADPDSSALNLRPKFITVPLVVQDEFLYSSSDAVLDKLIQDAQTGILRAMEKKAYDIFSGATNVTGSSAHLTVVNAEAAINGSGQYFLSSKATAKAKSTSVDSGSGVFVWNNGTVNGAAAHRAYLIGDNFKGYYVDPYKVVAAMWNEIKLEYVKDSTLAKAGQTLLNVSVMGDIGFDPAGVARFTL